ncbi:hypothetical protein [Romboutsia sp.]|uniref:hypothetical protein n=1 Tax=Romboutsia sp. TaxID=1965302 RepID=UPI003F40FFCB
MKINLKEKKVRLAIAGIVVATVIVINVLYSKVNTAQNDYSSIESVQYNIKNNILDSKTELLSLQNNMMKLNEDKAKTIKIDAIIADLELNNYKDESKLNANLAQLDLLNEEIDKMIDIYNNDENMKKNMNISNEIMNIEGLDNLVHGIMEEHNEIYTKSFNKGIKKFPVNIVANKKGWVEINKFSSIDE